MHPCQSNSPIRNYIWHFPFSLKMLMWTTSSSWIVMASLFMKIPIQQSKPFCPKLPLRQQGPFYLPFSKRPVLSLPFPPPTAMGLVTPFIWFPSCKANGWRLGEEFKSSAERKNTKGLINIIKAAAVCYCQHNTGKRPVQIVRTLIRDYAVSAQLNGFQKDALSIHLSTGFTARLHFSLYFPTQRLLGRR